MILNNSNVQNTDTNFAKEIKNWLFMSQAVMVVTVMLNIRMLYDTQEPSFFKNVYNILFALSSHGEVFVFCIPLLSMMLLEIYVKNRKTETFISEKNTRIILICLVCYLLWIAYSYVVRSQDLKDYSLFWDAILPIIMLNSIVIAVKLVPKEIIPREQGNTNAAY